MSLPAVRATEYLSAFSLAVAIWDHVTTLDSEMLYVWSHQSSLASIAKAAYFSTRYTTDAVFMLTAYYLIGANNLSLLSCKVFMWIFILSNCILTSIAQTIVAWEIFNLWERRKTIARLLVIISMIYIPFIFVTGIECLLIDLKFLQLSALGHLCGFSNFQSWRLQAAFGAIAASDLVIILLVVSNAMARPRRTNHDLIFALHRDGAVMYAGVLAIRIVAAVMSATLDSSASFAMVSPTTAISAIINSRLIIRVAKLQAHAGRDPRSCWVSK
ncbi:hypothetical protein BD779DRAFT_1544967 [Infundibulicybe gibba]|nr:hypothetical protein BD779DRAFT_1544967 [Infundibulicybe gibba]